MNNQSTRIRLTDILVTVVVGLVTTAICYYIEPLLSVIFAFCVLLQYLIWRSLYSHIIKWIEVGRQILVGVYLAIFLVAAFVPLYSTLFFYWHSKSKFSVSYLIFTIALYTVLVIFGTLLYKLICQVITQQNLKVGKAKQDLTTSNQKAEKAKQELLTTTKATTERQYHTKLLNVHASEGRTIKVRCLPIINRNHPKKPISLNWFTFMEGVEFLWD